MKKKLLYITFLLLNTYLYSQQVQSKRLEILAQEIEFDIEGLDEVTIENSVGDWLEVNLFEEVPNSTFVTINTEFDYVQIIFKTKVNETIKEDGVFRKFITNRINRAYVTIKVPKSKLIRLVGDNVDVISKDYKGDLHVFIEKGLVNFNTIQGDTEVKLFKGNVFGNLNNANIHIQSTNGSIIVNGEKYSKQYQNQLLKADKNFSITSINANVVLTTQ